MSGLTCSGAGLIALTVAGLAVKGMQLMRAQGPRSSCGQMAGTQSRSAVEYVPVTVAIVVCPLTISRSRSSRRPARICSRLTLQRR
jgi:hypothetical protein